MIFSKIQLALAAIGIALVLGVILYVKALRADLATSEANNAVLNSAMEQQRQAIAQINRDVKESRRLNQELDKVLKKQNQDVESLRQKLHERQNAQGQRQTIGDLAAQKPGLIEKRINTGTTNAFRCLEIASGAPLTEKEKNAVKPSEINPECPSIANPKYRP